MRDEQKTKLKLGEELVRLRNRVADLEQAESALQESERRLSTLMANLPGMAYRCQNDPKWTMEFVSDGARLLTGHRASDLIENKKLAFGDLIHPGDREAVWAQVQHAIADRRRYEFEYRIYKDSGEERWVCEQGCGVYSDGGELMALEGFIMDITPQKHAELAIRNAHALLEQRVEDRTVELSTANESLQAEVQQRRQAEADLTIFQRFVESSTQGFGMADLDGQITYANPFLARLFGAQKPEDVVGTHVSNYYPADYLVRRDREIVPALRRGEHWQGEQMLAFPDGQMHPTIHTIFPVQDDKGKLFRTAVLITDITELKRAEESLRKSCEEVRKSEERFELAVRGAGVGIWDWDIRTGKVYFSPRWKMIFGYDENEIGEDVADWSKLLHPEEREWLLKFQDDFLAGTETNVTAEYRLRHKDGSYRWILAHAVVVRDEQGVACRLVGSHADITDRKQAEEKVATEQQALRRMLMASDHDRELITYEIHDGIAQPLGAANMHFEAVLQVVRGIAAEARAGFDLGLRDLRLASAEARSLMNRTRTPVLNRFGLKAAIADFIDLFTDRPDAPEITYRCEARFGRLELALETTIFRVAQEAITNACIHSKSEIVRVSLIQDNEEVTLGVEDNGIGMDMVQGKKDRFGLDSIRERVRLLGKNLKIESTPGQGTHIEATFGLIYRKEGENGGLADQ